MYRDEIDDVHRWLSERGWLVELIDRGQGWPWHLELGYLEGGCSLGV
jgi:hypothetical protein